MLLWKTSRDHVRFPGNDIPHFFLACETVLSLTTSANQLFQVFMLVCKSILLKFRLRDCTSITLKLVPVYAKIPMS